MRTIAAISATVGFVVIAFAALQLVLGWLTPGPANTKLWLAAAAIGAGAAFAGTAVVRIKANR